MQGRMADFLFQVLSSLPLCKLILSTLRIPVEGFWCSLRLLLTTQMQDPATQAPHPRCSLSLQYAPRSTAQTPQIPHPSSASTLHINCFKNLHNYSTKSLAQRRISTTSQAICQKPLPTQNHPPVFLPLQTSQSKTSLPVFFQPPKKTATILVQIFLQLFLQLLFQAFSISFPCTVTILPPKNHKPRRLH